MHKPQYGEDLVNLFVLGVVVNEIEHVHNPAGLAETLDAPESLLESRGIPWEVSRVFIKPAALECCCNAAVKFSAAW